MLLDRNKPHRQQQQPQHHSTTIEHGREKRRQKVMFLCTMICLHRVCLVGSRWHADTAVTSMERSSFCTFSKIFVGLAFCFKFVAKANDFYDLTFYFHSFIWPVRRYISVHISFPNVMCSLLKWFGVVFGVRLCSRIRWCRRPLILLIGLMACLMQCYSPKCVSDELMLVFSPVDIMRRR